MIVRPKIKATTVASPAQQPLNQATTFLADCTAAPVGHERTISLFEQSELHAAFVCLFAHAPFSRLTSSRAQSSPTLYMVDTFSISALHLAIKVPYFSHSGHKNEKVTNYLPIREAKGWTASEVPITISSLQLGRSDCTSSKNRVGSASPKKTMSGLTSPPCFSRKPFQPASPAKIPARTSAASTGAPVAMHLAESKLPCAATSLCAGSPASDSSESMFCEKQRCSSPFACSSAMK
eukprot:SAG31_NODE_3346_length_4376_cov_3.801496_2_plen_236_part_00